jgi:hypothetical protein
MATEVIQEKQEVHALVELLTPGQLSAVRSVLQVMVDPVSYAIANAPLEDEEISDEEERAVAEARDWLKRNGGKGVPHAEAMRRLQLD